MAAPLFVGQGFAVEELFLAAGGAIQPPPFYEIGDPVPPSQVSQQDRLGARFGVDLAFPGDFVPLASGDLERTRELEGIRANFARSLLTARGEIFWRPDYGVGATEFLGRPANAVNASELKNRIRASLAGDERVESVDFVEAVFAPGGLEIEVRVTVAGAAQSVGIRITRA